MVHLSYNELRVIETYSNNDGQHGYRAAFNTTFLGANAAELKALGSRLLPHGSKPQLQAFNILLMRFQRQDEEEARHCRKQEEIQRRHWEEETRRRQIEEAPRRHQEEETQRRQIEEAVQQRREKEARRQREEEPIQRDNEVDISYKYQVKATIKEQLRSQNRTRWGITFINPAGGDWERGRFDRGSQSLMESNTSS
ncbi:MAG: hypothetical protein Q9171_002915 [Xanthocarpia ochracea]